LVTTWQQEIHDENIWLRSRNSFYVCGRPDLVAAVQLITVVNGWLVLDYYTVSRSSSSVDVALLVQNIFLWSYSWSWEMSSSMAICKWNDRVTVFNCSLYRSLNFYWASLFST